jgi:hypothetical protein
VWCRMWYFRRASATAGVAAWTSIYGVADQRIGVARLHMPVTLPCDMDHANMCASLKRLVVTAISIGA